MEAPHREVFALAPRLRLDGQLRRGLLLRGDRAHALNHTEWFAGSERTTEVKGTLDAGWTKTADDKDVKKLEIVEHFRKAHGVHGEVSDFRVDDAQCSVSFKAPGYAADAFIDRATGAYELTVSKMGFAAVVNDLHKGRDSGACG